LILAQFLLSLGEPSSASAQHGGFETKVRELLWSFYPEYKASGDRIAITGDGPVGDGKLFRYWTVVVEPFDAGYHTLAGIPASTAPCEEQLPDGVGVCEIKPIRTQTPKLKSILAFDDHGQISYLVLADRALNDKNRAFTNALAGNQDWSREHIEKLLETSGAKFGPAHKGELLQALRLQRLSPFTGSLRLKNLEFVSVPAAPPLNAQAMWKAQAISTDGRNRVYDLVVEPFEGKLTFLSRQVKPTSLTKK
jgi:hypothetical protein